MTKITKYIIDAKVMRETYELLEAISLGVISRNNAENLAGEILPAFVRVSICFTLPTPRLVLKHPIKGDFFSVNQMDEHGCSMYLKGIKDASDVAANMCIMEVVSSGDWMYDDREDLAKAILGISSGINEEIPK